MRPAKLLFKALNKSFCVKIENLEELSIPQIQELQEFVKVRRGIFDFESYTFAIQKKMSYEEFCKLLEFTQISATCHEEIFVSSAAMNERVSFGKYKGLFYSEIPDEYLIWLKRNYRGEQKEIIESEYRRRNL
jgi:phosphatidylinositol kinase/protein kinase (PI-3  family)